MRCRRKESSIAQERKRKVFFFQAASVYLSVSLSPRGTVRDLLHRCWFAFQSSAEHRHKEERVKGKEVRWIVRVRGIVQEEQKRVEAKKKKAEESKKKNLKFDRDAPLGLPVGRHWRTHAAPQKTKGKPNKKTGLGGRNGRSRIVGEALRLLSRLQFCLLRYFHFAS